MGFAARLKSGYIVHCSLCKPIGFRLHDFDANLPVLDRHRAFVTHADCEDDAALRGFSCVEEKVDEWKTRRNLFGGCYNLSVL